MREICERASSQLARGGERRVVLVGARKSKQILTERLPYKIVY